MSEGDRQRPERRRCVPPGQSPIATLTQLPALVLLERLPIPALSVLEDGEVLFANEAFGAMLGYAADTILSLNVGQIFPALAVGESVLAALRARGDQLVELAHADGSTVQAVMSSTALVRKDDPIMLTTFLDLTDQLWATQP